MPKAAKLIFGYGPKYLNYDARTITQITVKVTPSRNLPWKSFINILSPMCPKTV